MTQRPSDRAAQTLQALGLTDAPLSALERDDALFVLTPDTLLYQDGGGTRRVTLRDLTRIHSDQEGVLRVETPAGTALTASLLGFDPGQVQGFFGQVRDATARAKEQPTSPLPQAGAAKTFAPAPPAVAPRPVASAGHPVTLRPSAEPVQPDPVQTLPDRSEPVGAEPSLEATPGPVRDAPVRDRPVTSESVRVVKAAPVTPPEAVTPERPAATPVVISSSAFSPSRPAEARSAPAAPAAAPLVTEAPTALPALRGSAGTVATLARQADVVDGLTGRLRLLGIVLFVGAVLLAGFQFLAGERLTALWTLLAGGVGTITLMALAEMARLLVALARASGEGSGVMDVE
ncbi:hypothetical protein LAJ19_10445 [Deinococcus taeanensis]|uniref:hypothetical protein n=1 Tax=Deinococcus taeanensis TaxID=2737050 RepID=UPI001CDC1391|nr:hypothetical protein [Deinococcus taeanensis]UBV42051.1 hypothetical protein LAJ19_10445 [Deinococcus taeanensis]